MLSAQIAPRSVPVARLRPSSAPRRCYRSATWQPLVLTGIRLADGIALLLALGMADCLPAAPPSGVAGAIGAAVAFALLAASPLYAIGALQSPAWQLRQAAPALLAGAAAGSAVLLAGQAESAMFVPLAWLLLALTLFGGARIPLAAWVKGGVRDGWLARRVAVVGATALGHRIAAGIARQTGSADQFVGVFDIGAPAGSHDGAAGDAADRDGADRDDTAVDGTAGNGVAGPLADLVALSRRERVDAIVIALPRSRAGEVAAVRARLGTVIADVYMATEAGAAVPDPASVVWFGGHPAINIVRRPLDGRQALCKALFDRAIAGLLLAALLPLLLLIAALIRLDSRGPALFRQPRTGFNNVPFMIFKFRSMFHREADLLADRQTARDDPRVTRLGRVLRKLSLDELPQLLNVLRGDMSLVGPRPHAPHTRAEGFLLEEAVAGYPERHRIKPGITGWAQVNGARGEIRTVEQIAQRLRYDLDYIGNWTLGFDLKILWLTAAREIISPRAF